MFSNHVTHIFSGKQLRKQNNLVKKLVLVTDEDISVSVI